MAADGPAVSVGDPAVFEDGHAPVVSDVPAPLASAVDVPVISAVVVPAVPFVDSSLEGLVFVSHRPISSQ